MTSLEEPPKTLDDENPKEIEVLVGSADVDSDLASDNLEKPPAQEAPPHEFPLRQVKFGPIIFNPAVSLIGLVPLWALAGYCINKPDDASSLLNQWFATVIDLFTWFYIVANPVLTFFIVWIAYRFGHIKLGKKDDEPEFSNMSYFAMIFSAGVGVGLFFYGVSEPLWHREPDNYYSNAGYHSQNEIDQYSLIITLYHWGFAGWSPYLVVAIACGLASYQFGLPMTIRSTFYPMLGEYTWGWMGDAIDGYSIVMTVAGVCTSLGLGAIQIIAGCQDLGWVDPDREDLTPVFVILIWIITIAATISVVSGLSNGIKTLAQIGFAMGNIILFLCFAMEKTDYLLNLLVQTTGVYLQNNIFQIPFWTDAFGALNEGEGRAVDGNSSASWFIGSWTVFYMAWWVAWACFVGMFIARISKNRTLREVIVSVFLCPTIYALIWFSFMGGIGLRQQRQAMELQKVGEASFGDAGHFLVDGSEFCFDVPQEDVMVNGTSVFANLVPGITPVCLFDRANDAQSWFNVMNSFSFPEDNDFGGFGPFLSGLSIFTLAIYFITSSDSGSLVVDTLASNGASDHHWIQRVFWAVTEGAVACALLVAGQEQALKALQAASIVIGLPFNLFLFVMCVTIVQMCNAIEKNQNEDNPDPSMLVPTEKQTWSMPLFGGIFNIFEFIFSFGLHNKSRKEKGMHQPVVRDITYFVVALIFPCVPLCKIYSSDVINPKRKGNCISLLSAAVYGTSFVLWIVFSFIRGGFGAFAWTLFFTNSLILASLRMHFRKVLGYKGNFVGDITASSFLYPQALYQMVKELDSENAKALVAANHDE